MQVQWLRREWTAWTIESYFLIVWHVDMLESVNSMLLPFEFAFLIRSFLCGWRWLNIKWKWERFITLTFIEKASIRESWQMICRTIKVQTLLSSRELKDKYIRFQSHILGKICIEDPLPVCMRQVYWTTLTVNS